MGYKWRDGLTERELLFAYLIELMKWTESWRIIHTPRINGVSFMSAEEKNYVTMLRIRGWEAL